MPLHRSAPEWVIFGNSRGEQVVVYGCRELHSSQLEVEFESAEIPGSGLYREYGPTGYRTVRLAFESSDLTTVTAEDYNAAVAKLLEGWRPPIITTLPDAARRGGGW